MATRATATGTDPSPLDASIFRYPNDAMPPPTTIRSMPVPHGEPMSMSATATSIAKSPLPCSAVRCARKRANCRAIRATDAPAPIRRARSRAAATNDTAASDGATARASTTRVKTNAPTTRKTARYCNQRTITYASERSLKNDASSGANCSEPAVVAGWAKPSRCTTLVPTAPVRGGAAGGGGARRTAFGRIVKLKRPRVGCPSAPAVCHRTS